MKAGAVWFLGVAGLAALSAVAVTCVLPRVQNDLQTAVDTALRVNGLSHVKAEVSGQDVRLSLKDNDSVHADELPAAKNLIAAVAMPGEPSLPHGGPLNRPVNSVAILAPTLPPVMAAPAPDRAPAPGMSLPPQVEGARATAVAAVGDQPRVAGDDAYEAATSAAATCEDRVDAVVAGRHIDFEPGTYDLTGGSRIVVDDVYNVVASCPGRVRVTVAGYTDNTGDGMVNQLISQARAQAVADALTAKGLSAERLVVRGYGAALPVADNSTADGREKNRRIVFSVNAG